MRNIAMFLLITTRMSEKNIVKFYIRATMGSYISLPIVTTVKTAMKMILASVLGSLVCTCMEKEMCEIYCIFL